MTSLVAFKVAYKTALMVPFKVLASQLVISTLEQQLQTSSSYRPLVKHHNFKERHHDLLWHHFKRIAQDIIFMEHHVTLELHMKSVNNIMRNYKRGPRIAFARRYSLE